MLKTLRVENFAAVPYLQSSSLMTSHPEGLVFSTEKPNIIVGPNGSGKSALLKALSLKTLSYFTGKSAFDRNYIHDSESFWTSAKYNPYDNEYLKGLLCDTGNAPALYYRHSHIPGNECSPSHALFKGYSKQVHEYIALVKDKSSGQQSLALLAKVLQMLDGEPVVTGYDYVNWDYGKEPKKLDRTRFSGYWDYKAETLKQQYANIAADAVPFLLADEPELSLDSKAELQLWKKIEKADCSKMQVIVATHSLYPLMHPDAFNLVEAVPGYAKEVQALL